jgi:hypothetical protein
MSDITAEVEFTAPARYAYFSEPGWKPGPPSGSAGVGWKGAAAPEGRLHEQSDRIVDYFLYGIQGGAAHA